MWLAAALRNVLSLSALRGGSAACVGRGSASPGQNNVRTLQVADNLGQYGRNYAVRLPTGYDGFSPVPVLFYFHWWGAQWPWEIYKVNKLADSNGFALVSPEGMQDGQPNMRSWNVESAGLWDICMPWVSGKQYTSCNTLQQGSRCNCFTCYDDVAFVSQVYRDLTDNFCIDEENVFGFGLSNGGMFLYTLIHGLATRGLAPHFKGIVVYEGGVFQHQVHEVAGTAVFVHHGKLDTEIPINGGEGADHWLWAPLEEILSKYAGANGCSGEWQWLSTPFDNGYDKFGGCWHKQGCDLHPVVRCLYEGDHNVFYDAYSPELLWWQIALVRNARGSASTTAAAATEEPRPAVQDASCASLGCDAAYGDLHSCQCNHQCSVFGDCCSDYQERCAAPTSAPRPPAAAEHPAATAADEKACGHSASVCMGPLPVVFTKDCLLGGLGCNALGKLCCRFCGIGGFAEVRCPVLVAEEVAEAATDKAATDKAAGDGSHRELISVSQLEHIGITDPSRTSGTQERPSQRHILPARREMQDLARHYVIKYWPWLTWAWVPLVALVLRECCSRPAAADAPYKEMKPLLDGSDMVTSCADHVVVPVSGACKAGMLQTGRSE